MANGKKKKGEQPPENPKGGFLGGIWRLLSPSGGLKDYTGGGSMRKGGGVDEYGERSKSSGQQAMMKKKRKKRMMA